MTRIIQISDSHIMPYGQLAYGRVDTAAALADCVETINRMLPCVGAVDMAVVTGDLTDFGTEEEFSRFRDIMEPLNIPYRAIPGNHDDVATMRRGFFDQDWMPGTGPITWMAEFADLLVVGLDTNVEGQSYGRLGEASLNFLQTALTIAGGRPVIVATHHPPILTGLERMDVQNLRDSQKLEAILSGYHGELKLICGHVHRNIVAPFGRVTCQIAPGISHAVAMDLRVGLPNRFTMEPGGILLHEIRGGIVTHSIPVGRYDGPYVFYPDK